MKSAIILNCDGKRVSFILQTNVIFLCILHYPVYVNFNTVDICAFTFQRDIQTPDVAMWIKLHKCP